MSGETCKGSFETIGSKGRFCILLLLLTKVCLRRKDTPILRREHRERQLGDLLSGLSSHHPKTIAVVFNDALVGKAAQFAAHGAAVHRQKIRQLLTVEGDGEYRRAGLLLLVLQV